MTNDTASFLNDVLNRVTLSVVDPNFEILAAQIIKAKEELQEIMDGA